MEEKEKRLVVVNILIKDRKVADKVNSYLSLYGDCIIGRMGVPYAKKNINVLCIVLDTYVENVNALLGKMGKLEGVTCKALFQKEE